MEKKCTTVKLEQKQVDNTWLTMCSQIVFDKVSFTKFRSIYHLNVIFASWNTGDLGQFNSRKNRKDYSPLPETVCDMSRPNKTG